MTMTKKGVVKLQPEAQAQPEIIRHPNPVRVPAPQIPYNIPVDQRFAHNCRSKVPPVVRAVLNDDELSWQGKEKVDKSN
jgi:hypothetical protein